MSSRASDSLFFPQFDRLQFYRLLRFFHGGVHFELCRQLGRASLGRCSLTLVSPLCSLWRGIFVHIRYRKVHVNGLSFMCRTFTFLTHQWDLGPFLVSSNDLPRLDVLKTAWKSFFKFF
ncbi:hypothetical protein Hanom_Chr10g00873031 [Helianthus anomalus]